MKYTNDDLCVIIPILRFGSTKPTSYSYRWLTYNAIGRLVNRSATYVASICKDK